jgi:glycerol-3-phosphate cytidylyltransferase
MSEGTTGYLFGVFDLFHVAHLDAVRAAAAGCDRLVVGVATDELVEELSGGRPYVPYPERVEIVAAVREIAEVRRMDTADLAAELDRAGADLAFLPSGDLDAVQSVSVTASPDDPVANVRTVHVAIGRQTQAVAVLDALGRLNESEVA